MATLPSFDDMLAKLVSMPSVSSLETLEDNGNRDVNTQLAEWLNVLGFELTEQTLGDTKSNLLARVGPGTGGLLLAGHTDTVPFDEGRWEGSPFKLRDTGNGYVGLGVADMKGFFPIILDVLRDFDTTQLKKPLIILATADEETSMSGAKSLHQLDYAWADYAVIGEPTSLRVIRQHKGILMERIAIEGKAGHSSRPHDGHNAIEAMHKVIAALDAWRQTLPDRFYDEAFNVPYTTVNFGRIAGGDNSNRICGYCELDIDCRPLPGFDFAVARQEIRDVAINTLANSPFSVSFTELFDGIPAVATAADSAIVQAAEKLLGHTAESISFATEAPFLSQLGMQTIILGPGDVAGAHQPGEYLEKDAVAAMRDILKGLIQQFCL